MSGSIGGVDASIPLKAVAPTPPNPLAMIGQFANAQNALNQAKAFPGALELQQQAIQGGKTDLATKINQAAYGNLVPLLALPPGAITHDNLTTALASVERNLGLPTHGVLQHITDALPGGDGPEFDARMRSLIAAGAQPYASAAGQVTAHPGPTIDTGQQIQPTTVAPPGSPTPGQITPAGGSYGKTLTPESATAPVQIGVDPKGAPIFGTRQQFIDRAGGASPLGTGRLPDALRNPANAAAAPAGSASGAPGITMGVGPAQSAQMQTQGAASAKAFQDIADQGVQARGQNAVLGNMLGDLAEFAPGAGKVNQFKATVQRYAPSIASAFGIDPKSVAAYESFEKLANQIASAQGGGSDARLAVAQNANPSGHLSPGGADLIVRQLQGNADYLQARAQLAAKHPDQTDRAGFESGTGAQLDPRAFQFARMTPEQRVTYYKSLPDADKAAVKAAYNNGVKLGIIGGGNGG